MWLAAALGCGTTRSSDTARTATEQMLLSNAIEKSVNGIDLRPLAGRHVYLDTTYLKGVTDENYLVGTLRQHMRAYGLRIEEEKDKAEYVVEARAGALGTNNHSVLIGVPQTNLPNTGLPGVPSSIPELPLAKTTKQSGVAKIALSAYHRDSGHPVWQSGAFPVASNATDKWFFGAGPFQSGSIYEDRLRFAGTRPDLLPFAGDKSNDPAAPSRVPVTATVMFDEPHEMAALPATGKDDAAGAKPGGESSAPAAEMAAAPAEVVPTGHVIRLPPVDQKEMGAAAPQVEPMRPLFAEPDPKPVESSRSKPRWWFGGGR